MEIPLAIVQHPRRPARSKLALLPLLAAVVLSAPPRRGLDVHLGGRDRCGLPGVVKVGARPCR